jgi:3',5'-cyclic AMP phosphodiesterase CpdA
MKLVLISDTHLTPRAAAYRDNWYIVAAWIEAIAPDLVVHLGDITPTARTIRGNSRARDWPSTRCAR